MSEYQYYEFIAIDRPLTRAEQSALREVSSRAEITSTRFMNVYNYGDLRADKTELLETYFDAAVYVSNLGYRDFSLRLPREGVDAEALAPYLVDDVLDCKTTARHAVLIFRWRDDDGGDWVSDEEAEAWMPALLPLRAQILRGDLRGCYVAWLHAAAYGLLDEDDEAIMEPPVPAGLRTRDEAITALVDFLAVDRELFMAAAEASPEDTEARDDPKAFLRWIATVTAAQKDAWLAEVFSGNASGVEARLARAFRGATQGKRALAGTPPRSFEAIKARATELTTARVAAEARAAARKKADEQKLKAAEQAKRLDGIAAHRDETWTFVESQINLRNAQGYTAAVRVLGDLRALAVREGAVEAFTSAMRDLRVRHANKRALITRLDAAKLGG